MTIGTSNQTQISYIKEIIPGVTPVNPAMKILRMTGESLQGSNSTTVSEEIRSDRSIADLILTDQSVAGDVMGELSGLTYDEFFESALFADVTWVPSTVTAKTTIASTASGFTDSANGFITGGLKVGSYYKVAGSTNPLNNRVYKVLTVVAGTITTYPAPNTVVAAGSSMSITGSTIWNGVKDSSYSMQKTIKDATVPSYINYKGVRIGTFKLDFSVGAIAKITFGLVGLNSAPTETQISGLTEVAAGTTGVMNCVSNVTEIVARGAGVTTALKFTDLSLSYDNKLRELKAIGTLGNVAVRAGTIEAKATLNPYFENIELLNSFINNSSLEIAVYVTSADGYSYVFSFPAVKFLSQDLTAGGKDQDMIIKGETQAILDPASLSTMRISKF
jgi:hypothetical protein